MSNLFDALKIERPNDVKRLRDGIPFLARFSDLEIERMYEAYSNSFSAGWLIVDSGSIAEFALWLES